MRRIGLAVIITLSFVLAPLATGAQQVGKVWRIGVLAHSTPAAAAAPVEVFRQSLQELGYVDGKNIAIETRFEERQDRLEERAAELVRLGVDLIVTTGTPASLAARRATGTIPIVMTAVGDPVQSGLVASLARPGGERHWKFGSDRGDDGQTTRTAERSVAESVTDRRALELLQSGSAVVLERHRNFGEDIGPQSPPS